MTKDLKSSRKCYITELEPIFKQCLILAKDNIHRDLDLPNINEDGESYNIAISALDYYYTIVCGAFRTTLGLPLICDGVDNV